MKWNVLSSAGLVVLLLLVAACGPIVSGEESNGGQVSDYAGFVDALRAEGATVELGDTVSQPFFSVDGQILQVNGQDIQVFEYEDAASAEAQVELVSPDGSSVGTSMVTWVGPPHFYQAGRLIVLYVGDDATTLQILESVLGPQFAGD